MVDIDDLLDHIDLHHKGCKGNSLILCHMDHGDTTDNLKESVEMVHNTNGGGKSNCWNVNSELSIERNTLLQVDGCDDIYVSPRGSPTSGSNIVVDLDYDGTGI